MATLSSMFGILAALIASVGIYGMMSYVVARRTNEIGVRRAPARGRIAIGAVSPFATRSSIQLLEQGNTRTCPTK